MRRMPLTLPPIDGTIVLDHVTFGYSGNAGAA